MSKAKLETSNIKPLPRSSNQEPTQQISSPVTNSPAQPARFEIYDLEIFDRNGVLTAGY